MGQLNGQAVAFASPAALIAMSRDPETKVLFQRIGFKGIGSAESSGWNDARGLNIKLLDYRVK